MMQMAKKNYYDTSRYTYLVGYNEDKENDIPAFRDTSPHRKTPHSRKTHLSRNDCGL